MNICFAWQNNLSYLITLVIDVTAAFRLVTDLFVLVFYRAIHVFFTFSHDV